MKSFKVGFLALVVLGVLSVNAYSAGGRRSLGDMGGKTKKSKKQKKGCLENKKPRLVTGDEPRISASAIDELGISPIVSEDGFVEGLVDALPDHDGRIGLPPP